MPFPLPISLSLSTTHRQFQKTQTCRGKSLVSMRCWPVRARGLESWSSYWERQKKLPTKSTTDWRLRTRDSEKASRLNWKRRRKNVSLKILYDCFFVCLLVVVCVCVCMLIIIYDFLGNYRPYTPCFLLAWPARPIINSPSLVYSDVVRRSNLSMIK